MLPIDLKQLTEQIKRAFLEQDEYVLATNITEFKLGGKFGGDFWQFAIIDPKTTPPTFYEVTTPFDLVTKKAPEQALVFRSGECILNIDYAEYVAVRTGLIDGMLMAQTQAGEKELKVLMLGSGKTAGWSVRGIATLMPTVNQIEYFGQSGAKESFEAVGLGVGIELVFQPQWKKKLPEYDVIICHTNAASAIITPEEASRIKQGAEIHSFISSTEHGELADEVYRGADLICDWPDILNHHKTLGRITKSGMVNPANITYLREFWSKNYKLNKNIKYTIFQLAGTPLQDLAMLQILTR